MKNIKIKKYAHSARKIKKNQKFELNNKIKN